MSVVGAANSAGQAALHFARYARRVVLLCRGSDPRRSMSEYLIARIEGTPGIEIRTCTQVVEALGDEHLERLVLQDSVTGGRRTVAASWLFVFIGAEPHTAWLDEAVVRDERGFVVTGLDLLDASGRPQLEWIAARSEVRTYDTGALIAREGDPGTHLFVLVDGAIRLSRLVNGEDLVLAGTDHRGSYAGAVRAYIDSDEGYLGSTTALAPSRVLTLPGQDFAELMRRWFPMAVHLLDGLYVGIRNSEAQVRQREHLASLGTLSANLAHELNNPASAAVRATSQLRARVAGMRHQLGLLASGTIPVEALRGLVELQERAVELAAQTQRDLTPIELRLSRGRRPSATGRPGRRTRRGAAAGSR